VQRLSLHGYANEPRAGAMMLDLIKKPRSAD